MSAADYPTLSPKSLGEWRRWLREHHATARGVWLAGPRGALNLPIGYAAAVEEALCYGWIDAQYKPIDENRSKLLFAPRRHGSGWARSNRERVARLIKDGRMRPAGLAKIEAAKRDGSWNLLDAVDALTVPPDLRKALASAKARDEFDALTRSVRRGHLYALVTAKRPETRARRVAAIVRSLRA